MNPIRRAAPTLLLLLSVSASPASTQSEAAGKAGRRPLLPFDEEVALARSAAPASVSDDATVYVLGPNGYRVGVEGTSGVACYVSRSWPQSLEPHCFDPEGARTILPLEMHRVELYHGGVSPDSVQRDVAAGLLEGRFRLPTRPAMSWMMSAAQRLVNDQGRPVGAWRPHLMIYYPNLSEADLALSPGDPGHAMLVDAGRPTSNILVVVTDFVQSRALPPGG